MWLFNNIEYTNPPKDMEGFVYLITNTITGKKYIGKKSFWSRQKDKKTGRRKTKESDWQNYYSSSDELKADVKLLGKDKFKREILYLCPHKKSMSFFETSEQFKADVILSDNWYNTNIASKYFSSEAQRIYALVIKTTQNKGE